MDLGNDRFGAAVTVSVHWVDFFVPLQQHIVHAPSIYGQADDAGKFGFCRHDARLHMEKQGVNIPDEMPVLLQYAVWKAVDLFCFDFAILPPAHNVPPGGCTDVDCKIKVHITFVHSMHLFRVYEDSAYLAAPAAWGIDSDSLLLHGMP